MFGKEHPKKIRNEKDQTGAIKIGLAQKGEHQEVDSAGQKSSFLYSL